MSFKRIGNDNYVKDDITFQDTVNEDKEKVLFNIGSQINP